MQILSTVFTFRSQKNVIGIGISIELIRIFFIYVLFIIMRIRLVLKKLNCLTNNYGIRENMIIIQSQVSFGFRNLTGIMVPSGRRLFLPMVILLGGISNKCQPRFGVFRLTNYQKTYYCSSYSVKF